MDTGDRERLRATFDTAADRYHRARPSYPDELYDGLTALAGLSPGDRLLEVGCGTGQATLPLARRGMRITAVELGTGLAAAARRNLADFPAVTVVSADFESWAPAAGERFDLVYAATAWHWIDPAAGYERAWELLAPGGHLAVWRQEHVFPDGGDPFFGEIQEVYEEIGEGVPPGAVMVRPGEVPGIAAQIEASGRFGEVATRQFDWEVSYDADQYIGLLDTFSGHIAMQDWQRDRLYGEIRRRLARRPDGRLRRPWGCVMDVARRLPAGPARRG